MLLRHLHSQKEHFAAAVALLAVAIGVQPHVSSDFWNGVISGTRIGLLVLALVLVVRARKLSQP